MIGVDTNVLVRYLTQDDRVQYEKAAAFIEAATERGEQLVVNAVVLCELEWVPRGRHLAFTVVRVI